MTIACFFRCVDDAGPTGWIGFACGANTKELMWVIDEHVNPYDVEIQTVSDFSYVSLQVINGDEVTTSDHATSESMPLFDDGKWRKPPWVKQAEEEQKAEYRKTNSLPDIGPSQTAPF